MARTQNLEVFRGEDITLSGTIYTTDTGSTPEDITGWTLVLTVAEARNSTAKLLTKSGVLVTPASGTFSVTIADTELDDIPPGSYFWDLWRTDAGYERVLISGAFNLKGNARIPPSA